MIFEKYFYGEREVVIFVDEAGDPTLNDPGNPLFLFGACIATEKNLDAEIRKAWREVREKVLGDSQRPLHMRDIGRRIRNNQLAAIEEFFRHSTCKRVSFAVTASTSFELGDRPKAPVLQLSMELLLKTVAELTFGDEYVDGFTIVFEQGPLADRMKKYWPERRLQRKDGAGVVSSVPVNWAIVGKEAQEPGLEIADFIAHSAAGFTRPATKERFASRFRAIFPEGRGDLCRSLTLQSASCVPPALQ